MGLVDGLKASGAKPNASFPVWMANHPGLDADILAALDLGYSVRDVHAQLVADFEFPFSVGVIDDLRRKHREARK